MNKMIIANRLGDGLVVFLANGDRWVEDIGQGLMVTDDTGADALLQSAMGSVSDCRVIDPYLIDVTETAGTRIPVVYREAIRVLGPSIDVEAG